MQTDWPDYLRVHSDRRNLIIHIIAVPLFVGSFIYIPLYLFRGDFVSVLIAGVLAVFAMFLQGRGHAVERAAPRPFSSPVNFLNRWFREQFIVFPLFVLSGRWWQQFRAVDRAAKHESRHDA